jgi:hypothetical protein
MCLTLTHIPDPYVPFALDCRTGGREGGGRQEGGLTQACTALTMPASHQAYVAVQITKLEEENQELTKKVWCDRG